MNRKVWTIVLFLIFLCPFLDLKSPLAQIYDPSPADNVTQLVPYPAGLAFSNDNRIPIILIHGHGGIKDLDDDGVLNVHEAIEQDYWKHFKRFYQGNSFLSHNYRLLDFNYLSDRFSVWELGRSLRNKLDTAIQKGILPDAQFYFIGHSMGGLVARACMQEHSQNYGKYIGQRVGERITRLITLGTPHHGSPAANSMTRNQMARMADERDAIYQSVWGSASNWYSVIRASSFFFWYDQWLDHVEWNEPNRNDLLYDNFKPAQGIPNDNPDINHWLIKLNQDTSYDHKIFALAGGLDPNSRSNEIFRKVYGLTGPAYLLQETALKRNDKHELLRLSGFAMIYGLATATLQFPFLDNDGLVSAESALFSEHYTYASVYYPGADHLDLLEGTAMDFNGNTVFELIAQELGMQEIKQPVMVEYFYAVWCTITSTTPALLRLQTEFGENQFCVIAYHLDDIGILENFERFDEYYLKFGSTGVPQAIFDGTYDVIGGHLDPNNPWAERNYRIWFNERQNGVRSSERLLLSARIENDKLHYDAILARRHSINSNLQLNYHLVLYENAVIAYGKSYNWVVRTMLSWQNVTIPSGAYQEKISGTFPLNPAWDKNNLRMAAFIQNTESLEVTSAHNVDP